MVIIGCGYCRFSWDPRRKIAVGVLVDVWEAIVIERIDGLTRGESQRRLHWRTNGYSGGDRRSHQQGQITATLIAMIFQEFIISA